MFAVIVTENSERISEEVFPAFQTALAVMNDHNYNQRQVGYPANATLWIIDGSGYMFRIEVISDEEIPSAENI